MIKKLLQLVIIGSGFLLYGQENAERKFSVAISLGELCQSAWGLQANQMRFEAFPFDWQYAPFESMYKFIANEGKGFLDKETLLFNVNLPGGYFFAGSKPGVLDQRYGIFCFHDFEYSLKDDAKGPKFFDEVVVKNYEETKAKYERRIKRLFETLRSNKKVLFVRLDLSYAQACRLDTLLHTKFPQLDYLIVALDDREEAKYDWGLKRVKNFYLERQSRFDSRLEDWKKVLSQFPFEYEGEKKVVSGF